MKWICTLLLVLIGYLTFAQNTFRANSKKLEISPGSESDTSYINRMNQKAFTFFPNYPDSMRFYLEKAILLSEQKHYKKGKAEGLRLLGGYYLIKSDYVQAFEKFEISLKIFEEIQDYLGIANSAISLGHVYSYRSDLKKAKEYYLKSFENAEKTGFIQGQINVCNNLGNLSFYEGNYPKALEYFQKCLALQEKSNKKAELFRVYLNIGNVYNLQKELHKALDYYLKSLENAEKFGNKEIAARVLGNIGDVYTQLQDYPKALEYHLKGLKDNQELNDQEGVAICYNNIGEVYSLQGKLDEAITFYVKSFDFFEKTQNQRGLIYPIEGLTMVYLKKKNFEKSIEYGKKGLQIAKEIQGISEINKMSKALYEAYKNKGDFLEALNYFELYKQTQDSLFNTDKAKIIANLEAKVEIEQKEKEITLLNKNQELLKKDSQLQLLEIERQKNARLAMEKQAEADRLFALAQQEKDSRKSDSLRVLAKQRQLEADNLRIREKQLLSESKSRELLLQKERQEKVFQKIINYLIFSALILCFTALFLVIRSHLKVSRAKTVIVQQKEALDLSNQELKNTLTTVQQQKEEIEDKSRAIRDSIVYAKRIQQAILPFENRIATGLGDDNFFIFYKPRDIVSGDFYYYERIKDKIVLAAIDCTGHGVPGAFMSMISFEILNEIVKVGEITEPNIILGKLHEKIRFALNQEETGTQDGMDVALVTIAPHERKITFAGARNPLLYTKNNQLLELKADKQSIGGNMRGSHLTFTNQTLCIDEPMELYLFSDGYKDQFGGPQGRKFMMKNLTKMLSEIHPFPMEMQKKHIEKQLNTWMAQDNQTQIDDILLMGVRVS